MIDLFSGISSTGQLIIRLIAAVGGFVVGYMFSGPLWRIVWLVIRRQAVPPALLPYLKFCTGAVLAALLYTLVHLSGGGGWGWGGGGGSGTGGGIGDGKGTKKGDGTPTGDPGKKGLSDDTSGKTPAKTAGREILVIELLGGARYPGDGKYYLADAKQPPLNIAAVDDLLKARADTIELHIHFVADSVGRHHDAAKRLRDAAGKYRIPLVETVAGEK